MLVGYALALYKLNWKSVSVEPSVPFYYLAVDF